MTGSTGSAILSKSAEDYLKHIRELELGGVRPTTSTLAARLGVAPASVTGMTKRLARLGLVERIPYRGFVLTSAGRAAATTTLRHHSLLERYLVASLGLAPDEAHEEAERWEHVASDRLVALVDSRLRECASPADVASPRAVASAKP